MPAGINPHRNIVAALGQSGRHLLGALLAGQNKADAAIEVAVGRIREWLPTAPFPDHASSPLSALATTRARALCPCITSRDSQLGKCSLRRCPWRCQVSSPNTDPSATTIGEP